MADCTIAPALRVCTKCSSAKPETSQFFPPHDQCRGGLNPECRDCRRVRQAKYREANADRIKSYRAERYASNKQEILAAQKDHYQKNIHAYRERGRIRYRLNQEAIQAKQSERYRRNPEKSRSYNASYYKKHREKLIAAAKEYVNQNRSVVAERIRKRYHDRKSAGDSRILRARFSRAVRRSLKSAVNGGKSRESWSALVGYSAAELLQHLEGLFTEGMTLDLLLSGAIHIDHIRPVSSFRITGPHCPEFRACWALKNLQPLWAQDNIRKGAKWSPCG